MVLIDRERYKCRERERDINMGKKSMRARSRVTRYQERKKKWERVRNNNKTGLSQLVALASCPVTPSFVLFPACDVEVSVTHLPRLCRFAVF